MKIIKYNKTINLQVNDFSDYNTDDIIFSFNLKDYDISTESPVLRECLKDAFEDIPENNLDIIRGTVFVNVKDDKYLSHLSIEFKHYKTYSDDLPQISMEIYDIFSENIPFMDYNHKQY